MSMENITAVEALDCLIAAGKAIKQQWAREGSKTDGSYSPFLLINDWEGWRDTTKEKVFELQSRIASLEAERDRAVELLREPCVCAEGNNEHRDSMGAWICKPCCEKEKFLASIGGEGK